MGLLDASDGRHSSHRCAVTGAVPNVLSTDSRHAAKRARLVQPHAHNTALRKSSVRHRVHHHIGDDAAGDGN